MRNSFGEDRILCTGGRCLIAWTSDSKEIWRIEMSASWGLCGIDSV